MSRLSALILVLVTIAFGLAPLVTPPFTGYDPSLFPVQIGRPAVQPAASRSCMKTRSRASPSASPWPSAPI